MIHNIFYCIKIKKCIPRIHKVYPFPRGFLNGFIHSIVDTFIRFTDPIVYFIFIIFDDIKSTIGRCPINDDVLYVLIALVNDGEDGLF